MSDDPKVEYDRLFADSPLAANMYLMFLERAADSADGTVVVDHAPDQSNAAIRKMLEARFNDPFAYHFPKAQGGDDNAT